MGDHAALHRNIVELIRHAAVDGDCASSMPQESKKRTDRVLTWIRRTALATQFDDSSMQHYRDLQSKWQDDLRYLELRLDMFANLLAQGQSPLAGVVQEGAESLSGRGLVLCDEILGEHDARQRILSTPQLQRIEISLIQALNTAHTDLDYTVSIAIAERLLRLFDLQEGHPSGNSESRSSSTLRGQVLVLQAHALIALSRYADAYAAAGHAFGTSPSADAFALQIRCIICGGHPTGTTQVTAQVHAALTQLELCIAELGPCILVALEQAVGVVCDACSASADG